MRKLICLLVLVVVSQGCAGVSMHQFSKSLQEASKHNQKETSNR